MTPEEQISLKHRELVALCKEHGAPIVLTLWDGEHQVVVAGERATASKGARVYLAGQEDHLSNGSGEHFVAIDARTLLRLLPTLVLETHHALGLVEDNDRGEAEWLADLAKECRQCSVCRAGDVPCAGCQAGGICDALPCSCFDDEGDQQSPDHDVDEVE